MRRIPRHFDGGAGGATEQQPPMRVGGRRAKPQDESEAPGDGRQCKRLTAARVLSLSVSLRLSLSLVNELRALRSRSRKRFLDQVEHSMSERASGIESESRQRTLIRRGRWNRSGGRKPRRSRSLPHFGCQIGRRIDGWRCFPVLSPWRF